MNIIHFAMSDCSSNGTAGRHNISPETWGQGKDRIAIIPSLRFVDAAVETLKRLRGRRHLRLQCERNKHGKLSQTRRLD